MNLIYIANARMPTEKAHGLQITKMCEAYGALGHTVTLMVPQRRNVITDNVFTYYDVRQTFSLTYVPIWNPFRAGTWAAVRLTAVTFLWGLWVKLYRQKSQAIITRDILTTAMLGRRHRVFYEMHDFPERRYWFWRWALHRATGVIVTNHWKANQICARFKLSRTMITVAPNGYDPDRFNPEVAPMPRAQLGIKSTDFVIGYLGMLKTMGMDKGLRLTIKALVDLPQSVKALLVGGTAADIAEYRDLAATMGVVDRVHFVARVNHAEVASYAMLADVLIAPFPDNDHYRYYMSPIKLFEYAALGKPIVTTNLDSIKEILSDAAWYIEPNDVAEFVTAVTTLKDQPTVRSELANKARHVSLKYTWSQRASEITSYIMSNQK